MAHKVTVNANNVELPDGKAYNTGDLVTLTDEQFNQIPSAAFSGGSPVLTDSGTAPNVDDSVYTQGTHVATLGALTSAVAAGATPTKAEYDTLRADVQANRTALNAVITAITGTGKPMA